MMAVLLVWVNYSLFWPIKTMVINNYSTPGLVATTQLTQPVSYKLDYCKYTTIPAVVTRTLIDGQIMTLSNSNGYLPTGCHTTIVETSIIPDSIAPGTYYLDMVLRYPINRSE
jgi:hypothetical protein